MVLEMIKTVRELMCNFKRNYFIPDSFFSNSEVLQILNHYSITHVFDIKYV